MQLSNKARIEIVAWRGDGMDESDLDMEVFAAYDQGDLIRNLQIRYRINENFFYVDNTLTIHDGEILKQGDKEFRIRIEPVTGGLQRIGRWIPVPKQNLVPGDKYMLHPEDQVVYCATVDSLAVLSPSTYVFVLIAS